MMHTSCLEQCMPTVCAHHDGLSSPPSCSQRSSCSGLFLFLVCSTDLPYVGNSLLSSSQSSFTQVISIYLEAFHSDITSSRPLSLALQNRFRLPFLCPLIHLFFCNYNGFIGMQFTYHLIYPFKVYNLVVFNVLIEFCNHYHIRF